MPVPGAVTATQGDKRFSSVTDQQGAYSFADLADGVWTIRVEMLGFEPAERDVAVAAGTPAPEWELKVLPFEAIQASAVPAEPLQPRPQPRRNRRRQRRRKPSRAPGSAGQTRPPRSNALT